jgi:hypothetical protein
MDKFKIIHIVSYVLLIFVAVLHLFAAGFFGDYNSGFVKIYGL